MKLIMLPPTVKQRKCSLKTAVEHNYEPEPYMIGSKATRWLFDTNDVTPLPPLPLKESYIS